VGCYVELGRVEAEKEEGGILLHTLYSSEKKQQHSSSTTTLRDRQTLEQTDFCVLKSRHDSICGYDGLVMTPYVDMTKLLA
jgi:hypothetical protein